MNDFLSMHPDDLARNLHEHLHGEHEQHADGGKVEKVMKEGKAGTLHSGSKTGPVVPHGSAQEIAIALAEARKAGEHVSPRKD